MPDNELLLDIKEKVDKMHTVLVGYNGYRGVTERLDDTQRDVQNFCRALGEHEALPAHAGAQKDIDEINQILKDRDPGKLAMKAWQVVLSIIVGLLIIVGSSILTTTLIVNRHDLHTQQEIDAAKQKL